MKLLLDTYIWLWSLGEPSRLGRRVRQLITDRNNELWLSPVSTWDVLLLNAKGRIRFHVDLAEWLARATAHLREAPLTHEIVIAYETAVIPAKVGIHSARHRKCGTYGLDSRFRGNDSDPQR